MWAVLFYSFKADELAHPFLKFGISHAIEAVDYIACQAVGGLHPLTTARRSPWCGCSWRSYQIGICRAKTQRKGKDLEGPHDSGEWCEIIEAQREGLKDT